MRQIMSLAVSISRPSFVVHFRNRFLKNVIIVAFGLTSAIFTSAQAPPIPPGGTLFASGLEGPRGLAFGPDGLLRRHDYSVDILGGATGLNYASDYREIDGLMFPTKRRVYAYTGDYELVPEPLLVAVDISAITLS